MTTIFQIVDNMECDTCGESFMLHDQLLGHLVVTQHEITHDDDDVLGDTVMIGMDTVKLCSVIDINFWTLSDEEEKSDCEPDNMEVAEANQRNKRKLMI